jgi:GT2 family glycosyltransferase
MTHSIQAEQVTVVTVTFGARQALLQGLLRECIAQGVGRIVVVDNGCSWDRSTVQEAGGNRIEVVRLAGNLGSAGGYAAGIERALAGDAQYVWLLDDDNLPEQGCLGHLLDAYLHLIPMSNGRLAVAALRVAQATAAIDYPPSRERAGSFMHFHLLDVPRKIWIRIAGGSRRRDLRALPEIVYLNEYPYSGLLFHRSTLESLGLPRRDFVLYMDDIEFTRRLRGIGGLLAVVTRARVRDLEANVSGDSQLFGALRRWDRWRSYYLHRNKVWLDNHPKRCKDRPLEYYINMTAWLSVLFMVALTTNRLSEFGVLLTAIGDGLRGRMGPNDEFPLP